MPSQGETAYHQAAKAAILQACESAGWTAHLEVSGGDWRADVLAERGAARIAFEVQWSFLRLDDTLARQDRYARDGVRGCWFFRNPPAWMVNDDPQKELSLKAWKRLPLFHLYENLSGSFSVSLNGTVHPLQEFVMALLRGQIQYCKAAQIPAGSLVKADVTDYEIRCPVCGTVNKIYGLSAHLQAACGAPFVADLDEMRFQPFVLAALGRDPRQQGFSCHQCGTVLTDEMINAAKYGIKRESSSQIEVLITTPIIKALSHWCYGGACC